MKYTFDTEFIEDGITIDLISIGMVSEDGRELYLISTEFDETKASDWVTENVLPFLELAPSDAWMSRDEIRDAVLAFVGDDTSPEFWANFADYDWVTLCQLFGRMIDLPDHFPMYCGDLKQLHVMLGEPELPSQPEEEEHEAIADARHDMDMLRFMESLMDSVSDE